MTENTYVFITTLYLFPDVVEVEAGTKPAKSGRYDSGHEHISEVNVQKAVGRFQILQSSRIKILPRFQLPVFIPFVVEQ